MDDRALAELRDLAQRDAELAGEGAELRRRDSEVGELRMRAEAIDSFFAGYDDEHERRRAVVAATLEELARRRAELSLAEAALAGARDEDARIHAQHAVDRARDHIAVAEAALERAEREVVELEHDAAVLPGELQELERRSGAGVTGPRALIDWASREHAELFVAAGQLDTERERGIREANELATMLLGEPTYGVTVTQALERVEAYWMSSPGQVSESR